MPEIQDTLEAKFSCLKSILKDMGRVLIAFSGGVDSTLLLKVAKDVLGNDVTAVTALSATTPNHERKDAVRLAETIGVKHVQVETHELALSEFVKNPENKCYICKKERFAGLLQLAEQERCRYVLDGGNRDDHSDYRPGIQAVEELGVRSPLAEAGLHKAEIRRLSKRLGLDTWNKPSFACLASRIPYHSSITPEKLQQVDAGEEYLRALGLSAQLRVRHHGQIARLEIDPQDIPQYMEASLRQKIVAYFKTLGFQYVALDLEGYSMGSLNRTLSGKKKG